MEHGEIGIEVVYGGGLRIALVGRPAAGKSVLADALLSGCLHTGDGEVGDMAGSDLVLFVHSVKDGALGLAEKTMVRQVRMALGRTFAERFVAVGTHLEGEPKAVAAAFAEFAADVVRCSEVPVPVHAVTAPLWSLARREASEGRAVAAKCFRASSGVGPLIRRVEDLKRARAQETVQELRRIASALETLAKV